MNSRNLISVLIFGFLSIACMNTKEIQLKSIEFEELLRTNKAVSLPEISVVKTMAELTQLYSDLQDSSYPRSAPIPIFDEKTESILVLNPGLTSVKNGDIEIESIELSKDSFVVTYKEIENWEYTENNLSHPIVLVKVNHKGNNAKLKLTN